MASALSSRFGLAGGAAQSLRLTASGQRLLLLVEAFGLGVQLLETSSTGTAFDCFFGVLGVVFDGGQPAVLDLSELTALRRALLLYLLLLLLLAPSCVSTMLLGRLCSRGKLVIGL